MRSMRVSRVVLNFILIPLVATVAPVPFAWAQMPGAPGPAGAPGGGASGAAPQGGSAWLAALLVILGLVAIITIAVKAIDLRVRREAEGMHLQAQVSDALLRDARLVGLAIVPTAHVPILKGSPAMLEVSGQVPNPELREAALRIVEGEASRVRPDVHIEDRLAVIPSSMAGRAA